MTEQYLQHKIDILGAENARLIDELICDFLGLH